MYSIAQYKQFSVEKYVVIHKMDAMYLSQEDLIYAKAIFSTDHAYMLTTMSKQFACIFSS